MTAWSQEEHLDNGLKLVDQIRSSPLATRYKPRICFHLSPTVLSDDEPWSEEASFCRRAKTLFEALPDGLDVNYVGGTSGIEAYEYVMPSADWLRARLPQLWSIAGTANMHFDGWSFEPIEPAEASYFSCGPTFSVLNSKSPEGRAAIAQLTRDANKTGEND